MNNNNNTLATAIKRAKRPSRKFAEEIARVNRLSLVWPSFYSLNQQKGCLEAVKEWGHTSSTNRCLSVELIAWYLNSYHDIPYDMVVLVGSRLSFKGLTLGPEINVDASTNGMYVAYNDKGRKYKYSLENRSFGSELRRLCNCFHKQAAICLKKDLVNVEHIIKLAAVFDIPYHLHSER